MQSVFPRKLDRHIQSLRSRCTHQLLPLYVGQRVENSMSQMARGKIVHADTDEHKPFEMIWELMMYVNGRAKDCDISELEDVLCMIVRLRMNLTG